MMGKRYNSAIEKKKQGYFKIQEYKTVVCMVTCDCISFITLKRKTDICISVAILLANSHVLTCICIHIYRLSYVCNRVGVQYGALMTLLQITTASSGTLAPCPFYSL